MLTSQYMIIIIILLGCTILLFPPPRFCFFFIQITTYRASTKTRTRTKRIAALMRPAIPGHSEDVWSGEELVIPPLPPSFLEGCRIIDIRYIVQVGISCDGLQLGRDMYIYIERERDRQTDRQTEREKGRES